MYPTVGSRHGRTVWTALALVQAFFLVAMLVTPAIAAGALLVLPAGWLELSGRFGADPAVNNGGVFFRMPQGEELPLGCCWAALAVLCLICLYMLTRKIRGAEVIR